jgi:3-oxoacyl-[acyl-carrier protein] reductase
MDRGGRIVFVASRGAFRGEPTHPAYGASKAGMISLAQSLARRLGPRGIRVNLVAPGNIIFPGGRWEELRNANPEGVDAMIEREVPMKRFGTPEEIADAVLFLASERSSFTTGAVLVADGGEFRG